MRYEIGNTGRIIVACLEDGDDVYGSIAELCKNEKIERAVFWIIGGSKNVEVVTGPEDFMARPINAIIDNLNGVHEILGTGTLFPNAKNEPSIHMHASFGHNSKTVTGCPRVNLDCWLINEIILMEISDVSAKRLLDTSGFELLTIREK